MTVDRSRVELYNIPNDRLERDDLAGRYEEIAQQLAETVLEWKSTAPA